MKTLTNPSIQYKHAVLGLLLVKYVQDAFDIRRLEKQIKVNLAGLGYVPENTVRKNEQCR